MIPVPPRLVRRVVLAPLRPWCCSLLLVVASPVLFSWPPSSTSLPAAGGACASSPSASPIAPTRWPASWRSSGCGSRPVRGPRYPAPPRSRSGTNRLMAWLAARFADGRHPAVPRRGEDRGTGLRPSPVPSSSSAGTAGPATPCCSWRPCCWTTGAAPASSCWRSCSGSRCFDTLLKPAAQPVHPPRRLGRRRRSRPSGPSPVAWATGMPSCCSPRATISKPQLRGASDRPPAQARPPRFRRPGPSGWPTSCRPATAASWPPSGTHRTPTSCFVAHTLFEDVGSIGQLWRRIPLKEPVLARFLAYHRGGGAPRRPSRRRI